MGGGEKEDERIVDLDLQLKYLMRGEGHIE